MPHTTTKFLLTLFLLFVFNNFLGAQIIYTVAGNGTPGYGGDGGQATAANLTNPVGLAIDTSGNLFISDAGNNVIRRITPTGIISTVVGTGTAGYSGDGGPATNAQINNPVKISLDTFGNLYIADFGNHVIRKVSTSGIISTIAGTGVGGYNGDGLQATATQLHFPSDVIADVAGNIYIADYSSYIIRKVSPSGIVSRYAGTGTAGSLGDGGPATAAQLWFDWKMFLDHSGNMYIADAFNNKVRKISAGIISTVAGTGTLGFSGDGGPATAATLANVAGVWIDAAGNIYMADDYNNRIRKMTPAGAITTIAGNGGTGYTGDGGAATAAQINQPNDVVVDRYGRIFIADVHNNCVRVITSCMPVITHQPSNDSVFAGTTAKFWIAVPTPASFQWQQNASLGWVNMANTWPYSGVTTDTLTIHNAAMFIDTTHYRCVVSNGVSCTDTSDSALLFIRNSTGIANLTAEPIKLYPNPAMDIVVVTLPGHEDGFIEFINEFGQLAYTQRLTGTTKINLNNIAKGIYIVKIRCAQLTSCEKLLKL